MKSFVKIKVIIKKVKERDKLKSVQQMNIDKSQRTIPKKYSSIPYNILKSNTAFFIRMTGGGVCAPTHCKKKGSTLALSLSLLALRSLNEW